MVRLPELGLVRLRLEEDGRRGHRQGLAADFLSRARDSVELLERS